ncbi:unnamed protein product [Hermetia illucens]|uniref:Uncharacterized protein n=1 Tax=Hermetia illucens TaxID=343691 RepID=A0A7R8YRI1_HERIL|nr:unnamed protein product [Hermetia illucens]
MLWLPEMNGVIDWSRLPDPRSTTNEVYAFGKKIKNFDSLSKSFSKISIRKSTFSSKVTPTTSNNKYQFRWSTKDAKTKNRKDTKELPKLPKTPNDDHYENTEFHMPITPKLYKSQSSPEAQSSPLTPANLIQFDKSLSETTS